MIMRTSKFTTDYRLATITGFVILLLSTLLANARPIGVKIHYHVGGRPFVPGEYVTIGDGSQQINVTRLQFYLTAMRVVPPVGDPVLVKESVVLGNVFEDTTYMIGYAEVDSAASVIFGIGVPPIYNHLDPSTYPAGHPLGNQDPSMHWGWTAGYRFVVIEGQARSNASAPENLFEIHTVDDSLYRQAQTIVGQTWTNDTLVLNINMDIGAMLDDIRVDLGLINHSAEGEAITVMDNMSTKVFSGTATSVNNVHDFTSAVFPTPANTVLSVSAMQPCTVQLVNSLGAVVFNLELDSGESRIDVSSIPTGAYQLIQTSVGRKPQSSVFIIQR